MVQAGKFAADPPVRTGSKFVDHRTGKTATGWQTLPAAGYIPHTNACSTVTVNDDGAE
jgi:hypothetical protein